MRFEPVFLSPDRALNKRVSQTTLRKFNGCRRAGFLAQELKDSVQTVEMVRGSAAHEIYERGTKLMYEQREPVLPPELAKVLVAETLAKYPLPIEEHDFVREQAFRWACEWTIDPERVVACETLFVLDVDGWQVRCRVDHAELRNDGLQVYVADYKTGLGAPPWDEISRKRADGTIAVKSFQLILYALALVFGRPVRVEEYSVQAGLELDPALTHAKLSAPTAPERLEHIEPLPIAPRATEAICEFVYPGIERQDGLMLRQPMSLTRLELEDYMDSLKGIVAQLADAEETGDWPAVVSDAACGECPCSSRCPIPAEMRDHRGTINSMDELVEAASVFYVRGRQREADRREIKAAAKAYGGPSARVRFGADRVWEFAPVKQTTEIPDKDGMFDAVQQAVEFGVPFERSEFVKVRESTPFVERALTGAELDEEIGHSSHEDVGTRYTIADAVKDEIYAAAAEPPDDGEASS